jgi:hypothetical protein
MNKIQYIVTNNNIKAGHMNYVNKYHYVLKEDINNLSVELLSYLKNETKFNECRKEYFIIDNDGLLSVKEYVLILVLSYTTDGFKIWNKEEIKHISNWDDFIINNNINLCKSNVDIIQNVTKDIKVIIDQMTNIN